MSLPNSQAGAAVAVQHPRSSQAPAAHWHHRNVSFPRAGLTPKWTHARSHKRWTRKPPGALLPATNAPLGGCSWHLLDPTWGIHLRGAEDSSHLPMKIPLGNTLLLSSRPTWAGPPPSHPIACNYSPASNTQAVPYLLQASTGTLTHSPGSSCSASHACGHG